MRRVAMAAAFGVVVALALAGTSASGATRPPAAAASPSVSTSSTGPRNLVTTVDAARASVPLPTVPVSSPDPAPVARASRSVSRPRLVGDAVWKALARCESSGNASARSADGLYSGAFQFSDATWQSLGHEGRAADHPFEVQLQAAKRLQARSGWDQWPRCARRLGLV